MSFRFTLSRRLALLEGSLVMLALGALSCTNEPLNAPVLPESTKPELNTVVVRPGYYAATNGSSGGSGSITSPWTLATALAGGNGKVKPGDTVWVRGGTYPGSFASSLQGTAGAPVVVRAYPGERAIIDGKGTPASLSIFHANGQYSVFWGLEIMDSDPTRTVSFPGNSGRSNTVANYASHTKYINLVVHDGGVGFYNETTTYDVEIAGCIFYNNGWQGPDRGHGHGLYLKSDAGPILARHNVVFNQFGYGLHAYTNAGSGKLTNIRLEGNVAFNNGTLATNSISSNILLGGEAYATGARVNYNHAYFSPSAGQQIGNVKVGYGTLKNGSLQVKGNYIVGGTPALDVWYWSSATLSSNTMVGSSYVITLNEHSASGKYLTANQHQRDPSASAWKYAGSTYTFSGWRSATGLASNDVAVSGTPTVTKVVVKKNPWEQGRATVVVYNWSGQGSVQASMTGILNPGDPYVLRNVQNLFGSPIASGTFSGGALTLPLGGATPPAPIGMSSSRAPRTGPYFDVFVISRY